MSKPSKGGHVRGAVVPQAGGVVTGGSGFLTLANGVAMWVSMTLTNAGAINGFVEVSQSINGAPYVKQLTLGQNPLAPLNNTPFGAPLSTGQVIVAVVLVRDSKNELLLRSNVMSGTVP